MERQATIRKDAEDLNRSSTKKLKKMQTFKSYDSTTTGEDSQMDTNEARHKDQDQKQQNVKFLPRPPPQEHLSSAIGARKLSQNSKYSATSSDIKGKLFF